MKTKKIARKKQQVELLRNEILKAAVEVFKECGYEKATIKKIAEKAEVADGSIYNYFENKRDVLLSLFEKMKEATTVNFTILPENKGDLSKILSSIMIAQLDQNSIVPMFTLLLHESGVDPVVQKKFNEQLKEMRKERVDFYKQLEKSGLLRKGNVSTMAILMSIIAMGYTTMRESGDSVLHKILVDKLVTEITDILVNGLKPLKPKNSVVFKEEIIKN
jgi:TetR/AcrR family fatty acid metabolism transcriptional regulator